MSKTKRLSPQEREQARIWYCEQQVSSEEIGRRLGVSGVAVRATLKRLGVAIRGASESHRIYPLNEGAFDILTRESAYWLGFLITDGCVLDKDKDSSDKLSFSLHAQDHEHLVKFLRFLGREGMEPTKRYKAGRHTSSRAETRSNRLAQAVARYGVVPRKTEVATPSPELVTNTDFWRGVIDGDGEIDDGNNCPIVSVIGSFPLINLFCTFVHGLIPEYPLKPKASGHTTCTSYINLHGAAAKAVLNACYTKPPVSLDRKQRAADLLIEKYKDAEFRILKADIKQRATFPYAYTDLLRAQSDFDALCKADPKESLEQLLKHENAGVISYKIKKRVIGKYASHFFHEKLRMRASASGSPMSPIQVWEHEGAREKIIEEAETRKHSNLRASLLANCRPVWGFPPAVAKCVYSFFEAKRILDPCSGWGDRLVAAMATGCVEHYEGVDPNTAVHDCYERMRLCYNGRSGKSIKLHCDAFEDAPIGSGFDLVFTSPPYFDWERYSDDQKQSFIRYPDPVQWRAGFLAPLINKSAEALVSGGHMAINISNVPHKEESVPLVSWLHEHAAENRDLVYIGCFFMETGNFNKNRNEGIYCWKKR